MAEVSDAIEGEHRSEALEGVHLAENFIKSVRPYFTGGVELSPGHFQVFGKGLQDLLGLGRKVFQRFGLGLVHAAGLRRDHVLSYGQALRPRGRAAGREVRGGPYDR